MIDHISIPVRDLRAAQGFYKKVLAPVGLTQLVAREKTIGFGKKYPEFWLNARPDMPGAADDNGYHICLRVRTEKAVSRFHALALEAGGRSAGDPGPRQAAMTEYFGAFIYDLDGNKIEAVCFPG
ncbi:MAG: VOC family protein [Sneathiella sp.]